jgi:LacI family transcriptional regulator
MPPDENPRRVTLRDIARAVGMHFTTVSLALRNDPRLLAETRQRVQAVARSLGYVPDPLLASLSSYRRAIRPPCYRSTLAWITNHPGRGDWRRRKISRGFFHGAEAQAQALGYKLEEFWLRSPGMTPERSTHILRARGIDGLLIAPQPAEAPPLPLEWDHFSAVALGYSLHSPALNLACNHQRHSMKLAMRNLLARGYRRIGYVSLQSTSSRVDDNWLAGYLVEQFQLPKADHIPPLMLPRWDEPEVGRWLRQTKPDAIISDESAITAAVRRCGWRIPEDIGLAFMGDPELGGSFAGIDEIPKSVGAGAVNLLVDMIRHSERGIPLRPRQLLFEGQWVDGGSVRTREPTSSDPPGTLSRNTKPAKTTRKKPATRSMGARRP